MAEVRENIGIIPWLVNSNLQKMNVIVSHIGPTAIKMSKKKFKKSMQTKSNALLSRAEKEVESYLKVAENDQFEIYPKLTKLGKELRKVSRKLQRTHKLVKRLLIRQSRPGPAMMLSLTKTSLVVKMRKAQRIFLKGDIMVDVMVDYIEMFRYYVKALAKDVYNTPKMNSVFLSFDIFDRNYLEGDDPKMVAKVATESDLILAKRHKTIGGCNVSLAFAETLDQNSAAQLVKSALKAGFPAEKLIIPQAVRVRVADDGSVEMY